MWIELITKLNSEALLGNPWSSRRSCGLRSRLAYGGTRSVEPKWAVSAETTTPDQPVRQSTMQPNAPRSAKPSWPRMTETVWQKSPELAQRRSNTHLTHRIVNSMK